MDFLKTLMTTDYFVLFLIIGLGIAIGKIKFKGIYFDLSAIIFIAILFGYLYHLLGISFSFPPIIQKLGLILFIYTIGMQAGPTFFNSFKGQGSKLLILAGTTIITGGILAVLISYINEVDINMMTGLLTGALTSTPGLAAALETTQSSLASIGYGVAYPFGVLGVILFVKLSPKIFKIDIKEEEQKYKNQILSNIPKVFSSNFVVSNENIHGKSIKDLNIRFMTKANISRIMKPNQEPVSPTPQTILEKGDILRAVGSENAIKRFEVLVGHPTDIVIPRSKSYEIKWFIISNKEVVNKTLKELNLLENYAATITRIRRSSIDLIPHPTTKLRYGDKVLVSCSKENVQAITSLLGDSLKRIGETSFLPVAFGIVLGVLLGSISFPIGNVHFKLGLTGGVLLTALLLSWKGKTGSIIWNLSGPANQVLRQFGLLLFLTPVGLKAGENLVSTISEHGIILFVYGALLTLIPMFVSVMLGKYVLKMNFLSILGALTGGMTSTPGLSAADSMTETDAPQIAYAAVYPFALVIIIIIVEVMVLLL